MNNESRIVVHTGAAHFLTHFYEIVFPSLAIPLMLSLEMSLADVLKLGFPMYLLFGITSLPAGLLADRLGNRRSLVVFFAGLGIASITMACSTTPRSMGFSLALIGLFAGIYHPAGMGLLSGCVKKRGMALGINGIAGNLGFVTAPFVAGLMNWAAGWQSVYLVAGIVSLLWGVMLVLTPIDERPVHQDSPAGTGKNANDNLKYFVVLCAIFTLAGLAYRANTLVLPAYIELKADFLWNALQSIDLPHITGASTMAATFLASIIFGIGMFGQLAGGRLADRHDLRLLYFLFHLISLPFVLLMGILDQQFLIVAAGLYIFFSLGMQPIENSLVAVFSPARWRSTAYGIKFILYFGVGSLAVYAVGWIERVRSLSVVYFTMGGIIALFLLMILYLMVVSRKAQARNVPSPDP
ncbi:MAG: MFS transporter [Syntrophales bacterium]|jgi:MFS family permease|nr:MFS transporter [Syntrophales bacterium]MCK9528297.1 MFS transporter [Syntrophales bacterium]MDX9922136.1 MFS transporter [Syntrophales bacterium]